MATLIVPATAAAPRRVRRPVTVVCNADDLRKGCEVRKGDRKRQMQWSHKGISEVFDAQRFRSRDDHHVPGHPQGHQLNISEKRLRREGANHDNGCLRKFKKFCNAVAAVSPG